MFAVAHKAARTELNKQSDSDQLVRLTSDSLPEKYSLAQLLDELLGVERDPNSRDGLPKVLILHSCLGESQRLRREEDDEGYITKLSSWVSKAMIPTSDVAPHDDAPQDSTNAARQKVINNARQRGTLGLQIIYKLLQLPDTQQKCVPTSSEFLISILAFTSPRDIWSTPTSLATAQQLLTLPSIQNALQAPDFVSVDVLQGFIRPLFSASKPRNVTSAGRKAMPSSAPLKRHDFSEEGASKPWLYETVYAVTVLEWAVREISTITLATTWPLILPPLLTLLDTPGTPLLTRSLPLITTLLPKLPPKTLAQTGLASVFFDAIIPVTLYLPSITPLEESLQILPLAYEALFTLYEVQLTTSSASNSDSFLSETTIISTSKNSQDQTSTIQTQEKARLAYLTSILRQSILPAYLHASQHAPIVTLLLAQLTTLIPKLGVHATKHIKDILPIISSVLMDPFASGRVHDLRIALETFRVLVGCCWVRFRGVEGEVWRVEGVRCLVGCWGVVGEVDGEDSVKGSVDRDVLGKVREELMFTGRVFAKAVEGGEVGFKEELRPLLDVDESVRDLFGF